MDTTPPTHPARALWWLYEPVHAVTYFAPEARAAFEEAGLRGFWRGYFAGRAAPLGPVAAEPVTAAFFSFAPDMAARALPEVWQRASPERALQARVVGAVDALRRLLAAVDPALVEEAGALLERATEGLDCAGRVLAAAQTGLPRPTEPVARLWQAATVLREHRGDGHVATLVAAGLDGCEAIALRAALDTPRAALQSARGWTDEQWDAAVERLISRGWLTDPKTVSPLGVERHRALEQATDEAAARPWDALGPQQTARLQAVLHPIAAACATELPNGNPIGLPLKF